MFSHCASSQISSVDSYSNVNKEWAGAGEIPEPELSDSLPVSEESIGTQPAARMSVLDALSFSSDEDLFKKKPDASKTKDRKKSVSAVGLVSCEENKNDKKAAIDKRIHRDALGNYIPPPGGLPLARAFAVSPGPAAYYPNIDAVKVSAPAYLLKFRNYMMGPGDIGPGPGAYMVTKQCCPDTYIEKHFSPRFNDSESVGPGPATCDLNEFESIGKYKPKAIIFSRQKPKPLRDNIGPLCNTYGFTRFGKNGSPCAVLVSRPYRPDKFEPGPGAYDPQKIPDRRVGILIRGRPPGIFNKDLSIPGPEYMPPSTISGPAWPLVGKWRKDIINTDSPGPIYKPIFENRKNVSMTFRPFPWRGKEEEPGPLHYENVGDQNLRTKPNSPSAYIISRRYPDFGLWRRPGPNHYYPPSKIGFSSYNECSMKGHRKSKTTVEPGPADYNVPHIPPHCRNPPVAIIPHKNIDKPPKERSPGFKYDPKMPRGTVRNVFLAPRWKPTKTSTDNVPFYDLTGFTQRGKIQKEGVAFKSRQSPFVYQGVSSTTSAGTPDTCNLRGLKYEKVIPYKKPKVSTSKLASCCS